METIAVTGGARGIGLAIAEAAAAAGARVAIGDVDGEAARSAAERLPGAAGWEVDVRDRASFEQFLDAAEAELGPLDALVNNAGVMLLGPVDELPADKIDTMLDVNLRGVICGTQLAIRRFRAAGRPGKILNVASTAGHWGIRGASVYSATKFAVVGFSEAVRHELWDEPIGISVLLPGIVKTRLTDGVPDAKTPTAEPEQIAKVAMRALRGKRFLYYAPQMVGGVIATFDLLPRPLRDRATRALGFQDPLWNVDQAARERYESEAVTD